MKHRLSLSLLPALVLLVGTALPEPVSAQSINPTTQGANASQIGTSLNAIQMPDMPTGAQGIVAPSATSGGTDPLATPLSPITDPNAPSGDIPLIGSNGLAADGQDVSTEAGSKKWRFTPIAGVGYSYDDNIYISHTNPVASQILKVTGGIGVDWGDFREQIEKFLSLNYIGVGSFYGQAPGQNTYNDGYNLAAQYVWSKFKLRFDSRYVYYNGANVQVGQFTKSTLLDNALTGSYQYSEKTTGDLSLHQVSNLYPSNLNSYDNFVKFGFNYQTTAKLKLGLEGIVGFNPAQESPTRYYQTLKGRLQYDLTGKLTLKGTLGVMTSEYSSGGEQMQATPVFSAETVYTPTSSSTIGLRLYRNYQNSPLYNNQDYYATGGVVTYSQNVFQHWSASLGLGYENDTYIATQQGVNATRVDNYFYVKPAIGYNFLKFLQASVYYQRSFNSSTLEAYTWNDNQYGIEIKTAF